MRGLIIDCFHAKTYWAFALNRRGYSVGKRKFSYHPSEGLGHAKEWLEENYDIPIANISVENWDGTNHPDELSARHIANQRTVPCIASLDDQPMTIDRDNFQGHFARLRLMAKGNPLWNLSSPDIETIRWALAVINKLTIPLGGKTKFCDICEDYTERCGECGDCLVCHYAPCYLCERNKGQLEYKTPGEWNAPDGGKPWCKNCKDWTRGVVCEVCNVTKGQ